MKLKKVLALLLMFALLLSAAGCDKGVKDDPETAGNEASLTLDISAEMPSFGDKLNTFTVTVLKNGQPVDALLTWFPGDGGKAEEYEPTDVFTPLLSYDFDLKIPLEEGETLENAVINSPETIDSSGLVEGTADTLRLSITQEIKHHTMKVDVETPTFGDKYKDVKFTFLLDGEPIEPTDVLYMANGMKVDSGDELLYPGNGHGFDFTFDNMPDGYYFGTSHLNGSVDMESDNDGIWRVCCVTDQMEEGTSRTYRLQVNEIKGHEMTIDVEPPAYGAPLDTAGFTYTLDGKPIEPKNFTWFTPLCETTPDVFYSDQVYCADLQFDFPNTSYVFSNEEEFESVHVTVDDDLEYICAVLQNDDDLNSDVVRVRIKNFTGDPVYLDGSAEETPNEESSQNSKPNEESSHNSTPNEESSQNSKPNEESSHNSTPSGEESSDNSQKYAINIMTVQPSIAYAAAPYPLASVSAPYVGYAAANYETIDSSVCSIASYSFHSTSGASLSSSSVFKGCEPFGETIVVTCQAPYYFASNISADSAGMCVYDTGTDGTCLSATLIDSHTLQMEFFHVQPHYCCFDEEASAGATCTEGSKNVMRCAFCHDYYYLAEGSPALGHNFVSCNEWCECTRCGAKHDHYVDPEPGSLSYTPNSNGQWIHMVTCIYCNDTFDEYGNCVDINQDTHCDLCGRQLITAN